MAILSSLSNFDPISFLDIDTSDSSPIELNNLQNELKGKIGEYVLLKSSENLTAEQLDKITQADGQQIIDVLQRYVPDIDHKIPGWLNEFKNEYDRQRKIS